MLLAGFYSFQPNLKFSIYDTENQKQIAASQISTGDKVAISVGIAFTLLTLAFFIWKMSGNLEKDYSLRAVPADTSTPPLKPIEK